MSDRLLYVSKFRDRHGKVRYRFRRKGYPTAYFRSPAGTKAFELEYAAFMVTEPAAVGSERIVPGSVGDVIARYYADLRFLDLRSSTQRVYRGVLERFRAKFGNDPIRAFDAERISRLMTAMRGKPHAAARLRKLLAQLFVVARVAKLVPHNFDPVRDVRPPKAETKGYHRWTEDELAAFEAMHPLGTKARLAFALLLYGAQRSGDVRLMTHADIAGGRIAVEQDKTGNPVDVPIVEPLHAALAAGPLGATYLIETRNGTPYDAKPFGNMVKRACVKAGLPHCSAHGLRKSAARRLYLGGCTDAEGMEITGHKTVKEYRRYAGIGADPARADAAMTKMMANLADRLATKGSQSTKGKRK